MKGDSYEISFMKRMKKSNNIYWIFTVEKDKHKLKVSTILEVKHSIELNLTMSTRRFVVMQL